MNVASLELCKELYELSGWLPDDYNPETDQLPAYDLGYLMRKLMDQSRTGIEIQWLKSSSLTTCICKDRHLDESFGVTGLAVSDTPEDAACKLAIELFKQGVLKHD